ncbi:hypothetical protein QAD02_001151 [Eretmocerus hayati]|uniref:Uncharacterized protein n=1 Tax=Eretmocerus hayati TaxID=131215 RepID=A0ACC2NFL4_9HYME|nr:hypothetical protein QAD02_001151 [Eretmocerus hayati]
MSSTTTSKPSLGDGRAFNSRKSEELLITIQNATKCSITLRPRPVSKFDVNFNVQRLLRAGADPNILSIDGKTCLHYVAMYNIKASDKIVDLLLSAGASPDIVDNEGNTPLLLAASSKHENKGVFEKLIKAHIDVNRKDSQGWTSLQYAAQLKKASFIDEPSKFREQRLDIAQQLIEAGASVDERNADGMTSLLYACSYGDVELVKFLLSQGASLHATNSFGFNPLLFATTSTSIDVVQLVIEAGADINYVNPKGVKFSRHDRSNQTRDNFWKDFPVRTALHIAIGRSDENMLEFLLKQGADPNRTNDLNDSVLYQAISHQKKLSVVELLLSYGANMYECEYGFKDLVKYGRVAEARLFLEYGLDLSRYNPQRPQDFSPLHTAINRYYTSDMLYFLLVYNNGILDLEHENEMGQSPLCHAAWCRSLQCMQLLINVGVDIEHPDANGRTPLEVVSRQSISSTFHYRSENCERCIRLLVLEAGAKLRDILDKLLPDDRVDHILDFHENSNNNPQVCGRQIHRVISDDLRRIESCFEIAKFIVKFRVLYESKNASVEEPIENGKMGKAIKLRSYFEACQAEISLLKSTPLTSSINYHEILIASQDFHKRVRDDRVYETFDKANLETRFPIYAKELRKSFNSLKKIHQIWERAVINVALLFGLNSVAYYSVIRNILDYLDKNDLISTAEIKPK